MSFLTWIFLGLIAGFVGKRRDQKHKRGGNTLDIVLGIALALYSEDGFFDKFTQRQA